MTKIFLVIKLFQRKLFGKKEMRIVLFIKTSFQRFLTSFFLIIIPVQIFPNFLHQFSRFYLNLNKTTKISGQ